MTLETTLKTDPRTINYLRLSITDRCNLRCIYCMPEEGLDFLPHSKILSYEEMLYIVKITVRAGIRKIRLTGGEPLVRKDFIPFLEKLSKVEGLEEITLTTNGILLKENALLLKQYGVRRLNISLDSLKADKFMQITGRDYFHQVWEGIQTVEQLGFYPIKINVVAMKGINDDEILDFARLTLHYPYHIRFIEYMPIGQQNHWTADRFLSIAEIQQRIMTLGLLHPLQRNSLDGPAARFILEGAKGELGFIGALSDHFCDRCNRLRLTADGHLRGCLLADHEFDLKTPLRQGLAEDQLLELIQEAIRSKPRRHGLIKSAPRKCVRSMSTIGG
ncbi:MAG: GTP 3',8-cyclase MoaA [Desulfobacteraceae bacterium]|nr:MAG: GTP 3',8-cyclase MoaA [Desulfobacteraceae bacterium]